NLNSQEILFGQSGFISEWDKNFDKILKQLINKYSNKSFGIEEINAEILTTVESGCQVNPPNVV
ncbi:13899_t:CDS:2, partial [Dentiscutata erythropus]